MKKKSSKTPPIAVLLISSEDGLIAALNQYAEARLKLSGHVAIHEKAIAELNTAFDTQVQPLRDQVLQLEHSIQLYCDGNRTLFGERKSKEYANTVVGFRDNPHAVGKRISKDTFEAIAERLEQVEWGEPYLTYKPAVLNKEALLKDRATLTDDRLLEVGLAFTQSETFFIDIKATSAEGLTTTTEAKAA